MRHNAGIFIVLVLFALFGRVAHAEQFILVSDVDADQVLAFRFDGSQAWTSSGTTFANPQGITYGPDQLVYVVDQDNNRIQRLNPNTGAFIDVFVTSGALNVPVDLSFGPDTTLDGNPDLYVGSFSGQDVKRVAWTPAGAGAVTQFADTDGIGFTPQYGPDGDLYVSTGSSKVQEFNGTTGAFVSDFIASGLSSPRGIEFANGLWYVAHDSSISRYSAVGTFVDNLVTGFGGPIDFVFLPDGDLLVSSENQELIRRFDGTTGASEGDFFSGGNRLTHMALVPEPGSLILLGVGALYFGRVLSRSRRKYPSGKQSKAPTRAV